MTSLPPATPASKPNHIAEVGKMVTAPSPVEGEPKFPYQDAAYPDRIKGWKCADKAWRAHTASLRSSLAAARAEVERMRAERDEARRAGADAYAQSVKVQGWMSEETDKNGKLRSDLAALKVRVERAVTGETIYERTHPTNAPNWRMLSDAHRAWYESVADPTGEKGAGK